MIGTSVSPTIVGFEAQGGAYSGKISSKTKQGELETKIKMSATNSPVAELNIKLNMQDISSSITSGDVRSGVIGWIK